MPAIIFFNTYVAEIASVHGPSMYPYLNTDPDSSLAEDQCISWKWKAREGLKRGMIVSFWCVNGRVLCVDVGCALTRYIRSPNHPERLAIKRIIALEGDKVDTKAPYPYPTAQVPEGHVWVEGDNAKSSMDSNTYGPISKNLITGKLVYVIWPWSKFGNVNWEEFKGKTRVKKGGYQER
jgi:inner membrane protease subunit 2